MRFGVRQSVFSLALSSVAIILIGLLGNWEATEWLPLVAGLWVSFFSVLGAFQFFGWGRSAARSIYLGGTIGAVLVLLVLFVAHIMMSGMILITPAVAITFWMAFGLILGAVTTAGGIARQLRSSSYSS